MAEEQPIAFEAFGIILCSYSEVCRARDACGRNKEVKIGEVPVNPNDTYFHKADDDLHQLMRGWQDIDDEPDCTRQDNHLNGEPVSVMKGNVLKSRPIF